MEELQHLREERIDGEQIFDGVVVHLYRDRIRLPDGKTGVREYVRHIGAAAVLPITKEGDAILVRQFRYPFDKVLYEIPAGKRDSYTEDPYVTAMRELEEETGMRCEKLVSLGEYYSSPAILDEVIWVYLAEGLEAGTQNTDEDEFLETVRIPFDELLAMVERNEIPDGKTQITATLGEDENGRYVILEGVLLRLVYELC